MADDIPNLASSPSKETSAASLSLHRRHGLSPRQRRLLQAAARVRANNTTEASSPRRQAADEFSTVASRVSPSSQITPVSLNTSLSSIEYINPYEETNSTTIAPNKPLSSTVEKYDKSGGSGASTATTDATTVSISSRFSSLQVNSMNNKSEEADTLRGNVSDQVKRFNSHESRSTMFKSLNEEDEHDTNDQDCDSYKGPLKNQNDLQLRSMQPKLKSYQKLQLNPSPEKLRHEWKNDILKTAARQMELRYYRIAYPGVVSLLSELDVGADKTHASATRSELNKESPVIENEDRSNDSRVYLGYGEIVATSSPEITIPLSELGEVDLCDMTANNSPEKDPEKKFIRAIRVDSILTESHNSVDKGCITSNPSTISSRKNSPTRHYGYLLLNDRSGSSIAESIVLSKPGCNGPSFEHGSFVYRVCASLPVRVLSGPDFNAPMMKCALLPGTLHDISFRISVPASDPINDADVLVDDADAGEVKFLRLGRRKGWIVDRRVDPIDSDSKRLRVSYLMEDVSEKHNLNYSFGGSQANSTNTSMSQSLNCSSLNLSGTASLVTTPQSVNANRKRTKRRHRDLNVTKMLQESRHPGDSFDTESSAIGYASKSVVSTGTDSMIDQKYGATIETFYLMRVLAPLGLKILDAPHFQVSNLIHTPPEHNKSPVGISPFARTNAMISSSSADSSPSSLTAHRKGQRIRFLGRGQFFEASKRMESTDAASLYTNGQGLVKLADGSGWVIIPHHQDLVSQYENDQGGSTDPHEIVAFEEVGDATIQKHSRTLNHLTPDRKNIRQNDHPVSWLRIIVPSGVKVLLPPAKFISHLNKQQSNTTPRAYTSPGEETISVKPSSSSQDSEVASVVSSSFFDSVWSRVTPTKKVTSTSSSATTVIAANKQFKQQQPSVPSSQPRNLVQPIFPVVPCGMVIPVEYSESAASDASERCFVRLFSNQGWIPRRVVGTTCAIEVDPPDVRFGSFWFRVQSKSGIVVRHGPSSQAPAITSDIHSFRFECGEFLRASEVITVFPKKNDLINESNANVECFARLYRKNQSLGADLSGQNTMSRCASIQFLTSPGEWVAVHNADELFLEECSTPPSVERKRDGWRCSAIQNVLIRSGPSFNADTTGIVIRADDEFLVSEKVRASGDRIVWFRLKNDEGWVHSDTENGDAVVHCHIADYSQIVVRNIINRP